MEGGGAGIDRAAVFGEARVASHEMTAVPAVGATLAHSSLASAQLGLLPIRICIQYTPTTPGVPTVMSDVRVLVRYCAWMHSPVWVFTLLYMLIGFFNFYA